MDPCVINIPFWNRKNLKAPKMISKPLLGKNPSNTSMKLSTLFKEILSVLEEMSSLDLEAALLSRLIYRMKRVFRHDKILQGMQRVNRCLRSLLEINLISSVRDLDKCTSNRNGPTREMLQWILLSLQRNSALLHTMINRCQATVPYIQYKLGSGHHWSIAAIVLGLLARVWTLARYLCSMSCSWYKEIGCYLEMTSKTEENEMLAQHNFPKDLAVWLGNPSFLHEKSQSVTKSKKNPSVLAAQMKEEREVSAMYFNEDLGEVISRDSFDSGITKEAKKRKKK